jgi:hypothetical protein
MREIQQVRLLAQGSFGLPLGTRRTARMLSAFCSAAERNRLSLLSAVMTRELL